MYNFKHTPTHTPLSPHQVGKVVPILSAHQSAWVAEACNVLNVGLQTWRVGLQHDVDECGEEIISRRWLLFGHLDSVEDVFAAAGDAGQLVSRHTL